MALVDNQTFIRFLHVLSGITWIGMLYFFNLVNLPLLKFQLKQPIEANMAEKATAGIITKTLFWFRWGAAFTVLFGLMLAYIQRDVFKALMADGAGKYQGYSIMVGMLFGLVMAFNVWFIIWPRQKKILQNNRTIAASTDDGEKKRLGDLNAPMVKTAVFASRMNTWLSIPMLWGMIFGAHGTANWTYAFIGLLVVLVLMVLYSQTPKKKAA